MKTNKANILLNNALQKAFNKIQVSVNTYILEAMKEVEFKDEDEKLTTFKLMQLHFWESYEVYLDPDNRVFKIRQKLLKTNKTTLNEALSGFKTSNLDDMMKERDND